MQGVCARLQSVLDAPPAAAAPRADYLRLGSNTEAEVHVRHILQAEEGELLWGMVRCPLMLSLSLSPSLPHSLSLSP